MSEKQEKETDGVRISQVLAGALAAVTAALVGSTMGVAGTVVGAGVASVISTVGGTVYLRSIQRTSEGVRTVRAKVVGRSGGTTVLVSSEDPENPGDHDDTGDIADDTAGAPLAPGDEVEARPETGERPPEGKRRLRWPVMVAGSLAAFVLAMLAVTGVEWVRGEPLSGGTGTTFGSIVDRRDDSGPQREEAPAPTTTTAPTTTSGTPAGSTAPTSTTGPTTTSTTPPSEPQTTPTTTAPVTTTTQAEPPGGTIPPSG
jgi:hypothetical protein